MPAAPQSIVRVPLPRHGFFTIQQGDPDAVAFQLFSPELVGDSQQQTGGSSAVIGADNIVAARAELHWLRKQPCLWNIPARPGTKPGPLSHSAVHTRSRLRSLPHRF